MITIESKEQLFLRKGELNNLLLELDEPLDKMNPFAEQGRFDLLETIDECRKEISMLEKDLSPEII